MDESHCGAVAAGEAGECVEDDAAPLNDLQSQTAVEHRVIEPAPDALPDPARVYSQGVEGHGEGGEAAEGRVVLSGELLGEREEDLHEPRSKALFENESALFGGEGDRGREKRPPVERGLWKNFFISF